ncbi:MAG: site-specific integrase [Gammaproteobacteria bacterium]
MLDQFFDSPLRVQTLRNGPSGPLLEGFAQKLAGAGYAEITARRHIRAAEHLIYWADKEGIPPASVNGQIVPHFNDHLNRCRCPGFGHATRTRHVLLCGVRLFVRHLCGAGVDVSRAVEPATQDPALFVAFREWMREQRGTSDPVIDNYRIPILDFLRCIDDAASRLDAHMLRQFVLERSCMRGHAAANIGLTALRMFLRFLIAEGKCAVGLDAAIPFVAHWRLSSLPRYLQAEDVERIIESCDLTSSVGKRDRAILLLLARLALRAGDIVQLRLTDIDWEGAWLSVSGKSRRETLLPLTQEVGQAIVDYLQDGRPQCDNEALFIRARAPFRCFANHCAVSVIVEKAMRRAAVTCPSRGAAHVLRHSAATSMLRQGATLQDISSILRHRSIETTQIYAKVDITALEQIAQPWPEVLPC